MNKTYIKYKDKYYSNQTIKRNTFTGRIRDLHHNAKTRAKKKELDFQISRDDVINLYHSQNGECSITGFKLEMESGTRKKSNPYRISIDRIDSNKGYILDNITLVCWAVNQMKADRTEEEFKFWIKSLYISLFNGQSAAKPQSEEGSETISKESTSQVFGDGSARPQLILVG